MWPASEIEYFRRRAAEERQRAAVASPVASEIHLSLAAKYERMAGEGDEAPKMPARRKMSPSARPEPPAAE